MILKVYKQHFNRNEWIFFAVAAVLHAIIFSFYLPGADDFYYPYISNSNERLTKLWQILPSNIYGYTHINGRFFTHCTVQLLLLLGGGWWVYSSSGIVFGLLLFMLTLLHRHYRGQHSVNTADKYLIALLTLFLVPNIGGNYFGHTACTVNYLWGSAAAAFMLLCHRYFSTHPNPEALRHHWWLLPLAFVAATWNESFGISVTGALVIYTLFTLRRTNRNTWWFMAVLCIGVLFIVVSPGNLQRYNFYAAKTFDLTPATLFYNFLRLSPYIIKRVVAVAFTIVVCLISITIDLIRHKRIVFLRQYSILFLVSFTIMLFALFVTFYGAYMMNVASVVAALQGAAFCRHYFKPMSATATTIGKVAAVTIMAVDLIPGTLARIQAQQAWKTIEHQILTEGQNVDIIDISPMMKVNDRLTNTIGERYVDFTLFYGTCDHDACDACKFQQGFYHYYDIYHTVALPVATVDDIPKITVPENCISDNLYLIPGYSNSYLLVMPSVADTETFYAHLQGKALRPIDKVKDFLRHRDSRTFSPALIAILPLHYDFEGKRYVFIPASHTYHRQLLKIEVNDKPE